MPAPCSEGNQMKPMMCLVLVESSRKPKLLIDAWEILLISIKEQPSAQAVCARLSQIGRDSRERSSPAVISTQVMDRGVVGLEIRAP